MAWPEPVTLSGPHATLRPLEAAHHDGLCEATRDGELWRLWYTAVPSPEGMAAEVQRRLGLQAAGSMLPFTTSTTEVPTEVSPAPKLTCDTPGAVGRSHG